MNESYQSYHLYYGGANQGPYTMEQIRSMWSTGLITADAFLWNEAQDAWRPLVDFMAEESSLPQPAPPMAVEAMPMPAEPLPVVPRVTRQVFASKKAASSRSGVPDEPAAYDGPAVPDPSEKFARPPASFQRSVPGKSATLGVFEEFARPSASVKSAVSHLSGRAAPPPLPAAAVADEFTKPRPWRRYFARGVDTALVAAPFWLLLRLIDNPATSFAGLRGGEWQGGWMALNIMVHIPALALLMALEPLFLSRYGTTPGKWMMGLTVRRYDGSLLSFGNAIGRFFRLFLYAYAPLFNVVTCFFGYYRLKKYGVTLWDKKGGYFVSSLRDIQWAVFIAVYVVTLLPAIPFVIAANNSRVAGERGLEERSGKAEEEADADAKSSTDQSAVSTPAPEQAAAPDSFKDITNEELGMGFSMPGDPKLKAEAVDTDIGAIAMHTYSLEVGTSILLVTVSVFSDKYPLGDTKEVLENGLNSMVKSVNGRVTSQKEISLDSNPGLEFQFDSNTYHGTYRIYLVGSRMYQVISLSPTGTPLLPDTDRFFASFHLLKP